MSSRARAGRVAGEDADLQLGGLVPLLKQRRGHFFKFSCNVISYTRGYVEVQYFACLSLLLHPVSVLCYSKTVS